MTVMRTRSIPRRSRRAMRRHGGDPALGRGGASLARRIEQTWRSLAEQGAAECPVCGDAMGGAGECRGCGAQLG